MADKKDAQFGSLDDLFSASLDDIADLPAFEAPPPGAYVLTVKTEVKEINNKPAVAANFTVVETVELKDPEAKPVVPGTQFSIAFILGSNIAEGKLKLLLAPFAEHFGTSKVGELVRDHLAEEVTIAATITNRKDKEDPDRVYADVKNIVVA